MDAEQLSLPVLRNRLARPGTDCAAILQETLYSEHYARFAAQLSPEDALEVIEMLDNAMRSGHTRADLFQEFRRLCARTGLLPQSHMLLGDLEKSTEEPIASGGFGDVWRGVYENRNVAIKTLRIDSNIKLDQAKKDFCKEVVIWKRLQHKNVVPFLGVSLTLASVAMVSDWMPNGNIRSYVRSHEKVDRVKLLVDVTEGLSYLHSSNVVHGDLKGDNILINHEGTACLCDFGLTTLVDTLNVGTSASCMSGSTRWMAPELFDMDNEGPENARPSELSDIYALGMVFMEIFTGEIPFHGRRHDSQVIYQLMKGFRPTRSAKTLAFGLSDPLWELIEMCWHADKFQRPTANFVLSRLYQVNPGPTLQPLILSASTNLVTTLLHALSSSETSLPSYQEQEAQGLLDVLDQALSSIQIDGDLSIRCLRALKRISGSTGLLPTSYNIPNQQLAKAADLPLALGRFSSIWEGQLNNRRVRIKTLRTDTVSDIEKLKAKVSSEIIAWKRVQHPNLVPLLGISTLFGPICVVSPWMEWGIVEYLKSNPTSERLQLLIDVADGLEHLHSLDIIHGNLKATNVFIDQNSRAKIVDYGMASIVSETRSEMNSVAGGTTSSCRWAAPEILAPDNFGLPSRKLSKASDVYSFSMLAIEIFTGQVPFLGYRVEAVVVRVIRGDRPERPPNGHGLGLVDDVWQLLRVCWHQDQENRLTMSDVLHSLNMIANPGLYLHTRSTSEASMSHPYPHTKPSPPPAIDPTPILLAPLQAIWKTSIKFIWLKFETYGHPVPILACCLIYIYFLNSYSEDWSASAAAFTFCLCLYSEAGLLPLVTHLGHFASRSKRDYVTPLTGTLAIQESEVVEAVWWIYGLILFTLDPQYLGLIFGAGAFTLGLDRKWEEVGVLTLMILGCFLVSWSEYAALVAVVGMAAIVASMGRTDARGFLCFAVLACILAMRAELPFLFLLSLFQFVVSSSEVLYLLASISYAFVANPQAFYYVVTFCYAVYTIEDWTRLVMFFYIAEVGFSPAVIPSSVHRLPLDGVEVSNSIV